jgi:hypothetical protein
MVQPRWISAWLVLSILAGSSVICAMPRHLWDNAFTLESVDDSATAQPLQISTDGDRTEQRTPLPKAPEVDPEDDSDFSDSDAVLCAASSSSSDTSDSNSVQLIDAVEPMDRNQDDRFDSAPVAPLPPDDTVLAAPAGKIGAETSPNPTKLRKAESENHSPPAVSESIRRLPTVVANVPSPNRISPHDLVKLPKDVRYPEAGQTPSAKSPAFPSQRIHRYANDTWREPDTLLENLAELRKFGPTAKWASEVIRQIRALGVAVTDGSDKAADILEQLAQLDSRVSSLAEGISDIVLAKRLKRTGYALSRRIDVWHEVVHLGAPQPADGAVPEVDPENLSLCLANVDTLTVASAEGSAWKKYLLIDALKESAKRKPSWDDPQTRRLAQQVLTRLAQTPLTPQQQKFVATGPVAVLREELRRWAAEPIGAAILLRDIETYERSSLPSDAVRLANDYQSLNLSPSDSRRQLAQRVNLHYRNANFRMAVTEELINKLIPQRNLEYADVDDTVLGVPVRGNSVMATEVKVRMIPDVEHARLALEVKGEISSATTADAGPAQFENDSESYYIARKPLEIDMNGISVWPVEVGVDNQTRLRSVSTPLDGIPLIGAMARSMAKSQSEQNRSAATEEVRQKIAAQARQHVDAEAKKRLTEFVARMNERVFDPLNSLSLDPQLIEAKTDEKRFTMRLRLAGEEQLGSHTPRPDALADSLASMQIHESVLNNGIQRLQLNGRMFTLPELSKHVAARLNRPAPWETNPEHADVKVMFADTDAVILRCRDGQIILTLSIAQLSKPSRKLKWKNFQIQAFYRPVVNGRSAQLVREGVIHLKGQRITLGNRVILDGIFARALSKNNAWNLVPEQIVKEPKLAEAAITQFVIDDGWIGVCLGPKSPVASTARKPQWEMW